MERASNPPRIEPPNPACTGQAARLAARLTALAAGVPVMRTVGWRAWSLEERSVLHSGTAISSKI
jgi:hypothetical protein